MSFKELGKRVRLLKDDASNKIDSLVNGKLKNITKKVSDSFSEFKDGFNSVKEDKRDPHEKVND